MVQGIHKEHKKISDLLKESNALLWFFLVAFIYSSLAIWILTTWGTPPLKSFTMDGWGSRLFTIAMRVEWMYLFSVLLFFSALLRRWDWSLGLLSCLPWVLYNSATAELPSTLQLYYSFPLTIAVFWPMISHRFIRIACINRDPPQQKTENWLHRLRCNPSHKIWFLLLFTAASIIRPLTPDIDSTPLLHFFEKGRLPPSRLTQMNTNAWIELHRKHQDRTLTDRKNGKYQAAFVRRATYSV